MSESVPHTTHFTIGIFGGSFNPPTRTHLRMAHYLLEHNLVDARILTPCGTRPDKPFLAPNSQRLQMLKMAAEETFGFPVPVVHILDNINEHSYTDPHSS